ncbi:MAG: hypothetical protein U0234_04350 [Sandaracinus sp.]
MRRAIKVGIVLGALVTACGGEPAATSEPPATEATPPPSSAPPSSAPPPTTTTPTAEEAVHAVMEGHYSRARSVHDALVRADMDQARADMAWIATHQEGNALPADVQPLLAAMQEEASHFADATTLTEAGTTVGRMLVRCGACHTQTNGGPEVAETPIPEGDSPEARMRRHQWAADRMFDGLLTANAETFRSGNEALTSAPLTQDELPATAGQPEDQVVTLTTHVRDLGAEAAAATDDESRASIYGRYIATCGACHRLLEGGIPEGLRVPEAAQGAAATH